MNNGFNNGIPVIETSRLILRKFSTDDIINYYYYHIDNELLDYYDWKPNDIFDAKQDIQQIIDDYDNHRRIQWAVTVRENDSLAGDCGLIIDPYGLKAEVNFILSKDFWSTGIMSEALNSIISFCFQETDIIRIQALTILQNEHSIKLLQRTGFNCEGLLKKYGYNEIRNESVDLLMWSVLKDEYEGYTNYRIL